MLNDFGRVTHKYLPPFANSLNYHNWVNCILKIIADIEIEHEYWKNSNETTFKTAFLDFFRPSTKAAT